MDIAEIQERRAWRDMGLTDAEHERIKEILGRDPNWTELGMYAVLWSEHCAYKHSRALFHLFPTKSSRVLEGLGENAGVVDIGDGLAVCFKVESHNHPSAIEPYQGAATGVGGILRDIFTMGARPIAVLDSLRFGPLEKERVRYLFSGVVAGISGYGNSVGVPTVGGEVYFDPSYAGNPLVNVMAVGILEHSQLATASASGVGNPVMVVGARTGRDGIHGASFASAELNKASEERRPSVQVGDPFTEKLLIEACLELIRTGVVVGIQDMGAAGLTSSSAEMAARAGSGIDMDLSLVPRREEGMTPYEIMLSESQERMLVVPRQGAEAEVEKIFSKWGLEAIVVGRVTDDGMLRVRENGQVVAEVPAVSLSTDGAPCYQPEERRPAWLDELWNTPLPPPVAPAALRDVLPQLLAAPTIADKAWVFRQYDTMVQTNTVIGPGNSDAAVLRIRNTKKALAVTIDCNSRYCYLDPFVGAQIAVAEAARNVVATGAEPLAITDGLNFGNPEKPEIYWQLHQAVAGISAACRALDVPVTGGNASLYNETEGEAIYPTPVIGMVGLLADVERRLPAGWQSAGDLIVLVGKNRDEIGGSEYLAAVHGLVAGRPPALDLELELQVQQFVLGAAQTGLITSAHDLAEGGLAVALAECCLAAGCGAQVELPANFRLDSLLFGESQSRILISLPKEKGADLIRLAAQCGVPAAILGTAGGSALQMTILPADAGPTTLTWQLSELAAAYYGAIPRLMDDERAAAEYVPVAGKGAI